MLARDGWRRCCWRSDRDAEGTLSPETLHILRGGTLATPARRLNVAGRSCTSLDGPGHYLCLRYGRCRARWRSASATPEPRIWCYRSCIGSVWSGTRRTRLRMATVSRSGRIVLISIQPAFAALLFSRRKRFEYRRARVRVQTGDVVLLYETAPVRLITGGFQVGIVRYGHADLAAGEVDPLVRSLVADYLSNVTLATAIEAQHVERFRAPLSLAAVGVRRPPQSYMFLERDIWDSLASLPHPKQ